MNVVIWGYCGNGVKCLRRLYETPEYNFMGFVDNSIYKQGYNVSNKPIYSLREIVSLKEQVDVKVIIACNDWKNIADSCEKNGIIVHAVFKEDEIHRYPFPKFETLDYSRDIRLYAGNVYDDKHKNMENLYGLSLHTEDSRHILHDIRNPYPLDDECISSYESEDVFEYIEKDKLIFVINEIWRVLKAGAYARFSLPDFNSPWIKNRVMRNDEGVIVFDALGGGDYQQGKIIEGEIYFPTYEDFDEILHKSKFRDIRWNCYYTNDGALHRKEIDMRLGNIRRLKCSDDEVYTMSVDCWKK